MTPFASSCMVGLAAMVMACGAARPVGSGAPAEISGARTLWSAPPPSNEPSEPRTDKCTPTMAVKSEGEVVGKPVVARCVSSSGRVAASTLLRHVETTVGAPFDPATTARDLQRLTKTFPIDDLQIAVARGEGGVVVRYIVREYAAITEARVIGMSSLSTAELTRVVGVQPYADPRVLKRAAAALDRALAGHVPEGHVVSGTVEPLRGNTARVTFSVGPATEPTEARSR